MKLSRSCAVSIDDPTPKIRRTRTWTCGEKRRRPSYPPAPEVLEGLGAEWAGGDPVRAARMCVLFGRLNLAEGCAVDPHGADPGELSAPPPAPHQLGNDDDTGMNALVHSTSMLLLHAIRYLEEACAQRVTPTHRLVDISTLLNHLRETLAMCAPSDRQTLAHVEAELARLFTALAAEEAS